MYVYIHLIHLYKCGHDTIKRITKEEQTYRDSPKIVPNSKPASPQRPHTRPRYVFGKPFVVLGPE